METLVLDPGRRTGRAGSTYLVNVAHVARRPVELADEESDAEWEIDKSNPFITWVAGNFVEADKANSNKQFWTAGDLELAEYSIKYAPLNMVHKFRTPIGFYAATKKVKLERSLAVAGTDGAAGATDSGSMKIQALSGIWSHIFPWETALAEAADDKGLLFYSMECRGTHVTCAGPDGCGETFEYMATETHCEHLLERASIRHIVNPTFRGGALIVPPTKPGWKEASAEIITDAVMQEAASFAEQNEAAYNQLATDGLSLTAAGWEQLMGMVVAAAGATESIQPPRSPAQSRRKLRHPWA